MNILIVDDSELHRKTIGTRLKRNGHSVLEAPDGISALYALNDHAVDAVVSDILMPRMDGYELCQMVRASKSFAHIPVILFSAVYTSENDEETAISAGADRFFRKPLVEKDLLKALNELASGTRTRASLPASQAPSELKEYSARLVERLEETVAALRRQQEEQRVTEQKLRESEEQLRAMINTEPECVKMLDADGRILQMNPAGLAMVEADEPQTVIGKSAFSIILPEYHDAFRSLLRDAYAGNKRMLEFGIIGLKGGRRWLETHAVPLRDRNGVITSVLSVTRDITERKKTEETLRQHAALLDVDPAAIYVLDHDGRVTFWNKSAERIYGWSKEEMLGTEFVSRLEGEAVQQFQDAWAKVFAEKKWVGTGQFARADGSLVIIESDWTLMADLAGRQPSVYVVDSDVTEKKKLEAQFLRAQRMESLGMVAGGIAHDLNNILGPILLSVQVSRKQTADQKLLRLLDMIEVSAKRGSEIVKQILGFARGKEGLRSTMQLETLVNEISEFLRETFPKSIRIETKIPAKLWIVSANPTHLHQVLLNLCINARDAMPNGGTLTLSAENLFLDEQYALLSPGLSAGPYVVLSVQDTGAGIPPGIKDRIFEPFFTTKSHTEGTGLGLSTVAGIVQNHGGFVNVQSEVGRGSTFKVHLPALATPETQEAVKTLKQLPAGKGETILVVDDEPTIREITKETLEAYGYVVLTAGDGTEAVSLFASQAEKIEVVICDVSMPFMDGPATIRALMNLKPSISVVVVSGYTEAGKLVKDLDGVRAFLPKPYTAEKLLKTIDGVVQGGQRRKTR